MTHWRTDHEYNRTAFAIAQMASEHPPSDARIQRIYEWLRDNNRLSEAASLLAASERVWRKGEMAGWDEAHLLTELQAAGMPVLALVKDVETAVTGAAG